MTTVPLVWSLSGGVQALAAPDSAFPIACNRDGSVVVGYVFDAATDEQRAARWDGSGLTVLPGGIDQAVAIAADADVVIGATLNTDVQVLYHWTAGVGALLTPLAVDTGFLGSFSDVSTSALRACSDNGSYIIGQSLMANMPIGAPCVWHAGTPTRLAAPAGSHVYQSGVYQMGAQLTSSSADGLTIAGTVDLVEDGTWTSTPAFWQSGVCHPLQINTPAFGSNYAAYIDGPGQTIYGTVLGDDEFTHLVYWDALSTTNGDGSYGTLHYLDGDPAGLQIVYVSDTGKRAVGELSLDGAPSPARWIGTTATPLPLPSDQTWAGVSACSGDGNIVVGNYQDANNINFPVYWDAANTRHALAGPPGYTDLWVSGISRDGTTAFGIATPPSAEPTPDPLPDPTPPPPASPAPPITSVRGLSAPLLSGNLFALAARLYGDQNQWIRLLEANNLTDPFIASDSPTSLLIPSRSNPNTFGVPTMGLSVPMTLPSIGLYGTDDYNDGSIYG